MKSNYKKIGDYVNLVEERNKDLQELPLIGLSITKQFIPSIANTIGTDMSTYRTIYKNQFAYSAVTSRNGDKLTIALFKDLDKGLISQAYTPFEITDTNKLLPDYLMMWFSRPEFDSYARFKSHGSARELFSWEDLCETLIPIPHPDKQKEIVKEYNTIVNRIALNNQLIKKLEETAQAIYREWFVDFEFPNEEGKSYKSNGGEMVESELGEIPKGWEVKTLLEAASYINRGITPKYIENGGTVVLNQKCIRNNSIDFSFSKWHDTNIKKIDKERKILTTV
jgi:type I restriction enzyme S subunit